MTVILIVTQPVLCFKVCPVTVLLQLHYSLVTAGEYRRTLVLIDFSQFVCYTIYKCSSLTLFEMLS